MDSHFIRTVNPEISRVKVTRIILKIFCCPPKNAASHDMERGINGAPTPDIMGSMITRPTCVQYRADGVDGPQEMEIN